MWSNDKSSLTPPEKRPEEKTNADGGVQCSALLGGILPYELSATEKEEVRSYIKAIHPQSQNSTIVLDSSDLPEDLKGLVSIACRDKAVTESESRSLLARSREYMAAHSQNHGGQNVQ